MGISHCGEHQCYLGFILCTESAPVVKIHNSKHQMGNILYIFAVILVIAWAIGFLGYQTGSIIHILLVLAVISVLVRVIGRGRVD